MGDYQQERALAKNRVRRRGIYLLPNLLTTAASRVILQLDLSVLPFSAAEEDDARQWMSKAGGVGTAGGASAGLVDALIGTTISAKPIASYRWNVDLSLR